MVEGKKVYRLGAFAVDGGVGGGGDGEAMHLNDVAGGIMGVLWRLMGWGE